MRRCLQNGRIMDMYCTKVFNKTDRKQIEMANNLAMSDDEEKGFISRCWHWCHCHEYL